MSRPPTFEPPGCARARTLATARGDFAVLDARPGTSPGAAPETSGGPVRGTAVLVPGFTGSKEDFIALLQPLADAGYRAVAIDGRGQYESPGGDDPAEYTLSELGRDLLAQTAAITAEGDGGPVHLLGHSLGGLISRTAVLTDASPFLTLTLMASGPARVGPAQRERIRLLSDALATMSPAEVWEAMRALEPPADTELEGAGRDAHQDRLRERWLRTRPGQLIGTGRALTGEPDRVGELAAVRPLPKHVLSGERDETWPVPLMDEMAVRLGAARTIVAGAEHSPNTDRPAETAAALIAFWDRHGTRSRPVDGGTPGDRIP
ncbi:alpha/beta hydrolase [Streptomyces sp. NPDC006798]|uniref:alpha/beta fold hydrolase n=1 Tax=Streptomyces sp. NPDC006798 TaxID=3155462 RepID=UPI0033EC12C0